jgi:AraC-like DNA-binding protein/mannose-6-phosphate isomerase-like protein (cupin superfamily)
MLNNLKITSRFLGGNPQFKTTTMKFDETFVPAREGVPLKNNNALIYREFNYDEVNVEYHSHDEFEITYFEQGKGKRIIGSEIQEYREGDLLIIGPGVPHLFQGDELPNGGFMGAQCHVIQIRADFFRNSFFDYNELSVFCVLREEFKKSVTFSKSTSSVVFPLIKQIAAEQGAERVITLLMILRILVESDEFKTMTKDRDAKVPKFDSERWKIIFKYILENYQKDISLNEAASLIGLSKPAFCSYFKKYSQKRFTEFTNELRIRKACNMLTHTSQRVAQICYSVGFNNLSYFNREFYKITGYTPSVYRRKFTKSGFKA